MAQIKEQYLTYRSFVWGWLVFASYSAAPPPWSPASLIRDAQKLHPVSKPQQNTSRPTQVCTQSFFIKARSCSPRVETVVENVRKSPRMKFGLRAEREAPRRAVLCVAGSFEVSLIGQQKGNERKKKEEAEGTGWRKRDTHLPYNFSRPPLMGSSSSSYMSWT